jgi:hypothetical protein
MYDSEKKSLQKYWRRQNQGGDVITLCIHQGPSPFPLSHEDSPTQAQPGPLPGLRADSGSFDFRAGRSDRLGACFIVGEPDARVSYRARPRRRVGQRIPRPENRFGRAAGPARTGHTVSATGDIIPGAQQRYLAGAWNSWKLDPLPTTPPNYDRKSRSVSASGWSRASRKNKPARRTSPPPHPPREPMPCNWWAEAASGETTGSEKHLWVKKSAEGTEEQWSESRLHRLCRDGRGREGARQSPGHRSNQAHATRPPAWGSLAVRRGMPLKRRTPPCKGSVKDRGPGRAAKNVANLESLALTGNGQAFRRPAVLP